MLTVVKDSNDAVTLHDIKGNILDWNRGAENIYGYTKAEAVKMNINNIVPKDKQKENSELIDKIRSGENINAFKTQRITKAGEVLKVWLTVTRLTDDEGKLTAIATTERNLAWLPK